MFIRQCRLWHARMADKCHNIFSQKASNLFLWKPIPHHLFTTSIWFDTILRLEGEREKKRERVISSVAHPLHDLSFARIYDHQYKNNYLMEAIHQFYAISLLSLHSSRMIKHLFHFRNDLLQKITISVLFHFCFFFSLFFFISFSLMCSCYVHFVCLGYDVPCVPFIIYWILILSARAWINQYELTLVASDSLNENHTKIIINVRDVNDLPPVFPKKNYNYTMDEEIPAPFRFLQVKII